MSLVRYPFTPAYASGGALSRAPEVSALVSEARGPIIEVGGPTAAGYNLLGNTALLPGSPIVSNLKLLPDAHIAFDAKAMPFPDSSVGMFLARCISDADFFAHPSANTGEKQKQLAALAVEEYEQLAADTSFVPVYNLRLSILKEMRRTIKPNGIVIFERLSEQDIMCSEKIGLTAVHVSVQGDNYDAVLRAND